MTHLTLTQRTAGPLLPRQRNAAPTWTGAAVLLGRQSIFTTHGDRAACELLYRSAHLSAPVDRWSAREQDRATRHVVLAALGCGIAALSADRPAFVNATRSMVTGAMDLPVLPAQLGIEVVESVVVDAEVIAGVQRLRRNGHLIAVDDFSAHPNQVPLLPYANVVKIDIRDLNTQGPDLLALARSHGARTVLERVETIDDLKRAQDLGFDYVQGYLLERPMVLDVGFRQSSAPRC